MQKIWGIRKSLKRTVMFMVDVSGNLRTEG